MTPSPATLFPLEPVGRVRRTDPATSRDAARSLDPNALRGMKRLALSVVAESGGATLDEVYDAMQREWPDAGIERNSVSRRLADLRDDGLVETTGATRPGRKGREQSVWRVAS